MLNKMMSLVRKRGLVLLVLSVLSALLAAKGGVHGVHQYGFFDGPV
jgi:hypothetical protein